MAPYWEADAFGGLLAALYRSQRMRRAVVEMSPESSYRRTVLLRFFAWCYRRLNEGRGVPSAVFSEDFELRQTAAIIDTAGTFTGRDALTEVLAELHTAFEEIAFEPVDYLEIDPTQVLFRVRFRALGRGSGLRLDRKVGHLFQFSLQGNATGLDVFWEEADALEAAGLSRSSTPSSE